MADVPKDPQQELEELLNAQADITRQIEAQRKVTRDAALTTIKKLVSAHNFTIKDFKEFMKAATPRKSTPRKAKPVKAAA
jgi:phytoene/squalene synthetase